MIRGISPNAEMRTKLFVVSHLIPHRKYDAIIILHRINDKNTGTIEMEGIYPKEYVLVFIKNLPGIKTYLLSIERKDGRKILQ